MLLPLFLLVAYSTSSRSEFSLNFQSNPNVVGSIVNWGCNAGGGGGGMMGGGGGGMGMFGPGCGSDYFLQELVNDGGTEYYHVILGDPSQDDFALEFYMRVGDCCWWGSGGGGGGGMGGGGGGGMMGGSAPYSSSYGDTTDRLASAWLPLEGADLVGNGTGNPNRVYMRQINNDPQMVQEFVKDFETTKPRITQVIEDGIMTSTFDLDMRNGGHGSYTDPSRYINDTTISGIGTFDATAPTPASDIESVPTPDSDIKLTAGRYIYSADNPAGTPHGNSYGTYTYEDGDFDVYNVDWLSYCDPSQNPDLQCNFSSGGGGMMGGGGMGGGGMGGR